MFSICLRKCICKFSFLFYIITRKFLSETCIRLFFPLREKPANTKLHYLVIINFSLKVDFFSRYLKLAEVSENTSESRALPNSNKHQASTTITTHSIHMPLKEKRRNVISLTRSPSDKRMASGYLVHTMSAASAAPSRSSAVIRHGQRDTDTVTKRPR